MEGALEDVQVGGVLGQHRDDLDAGGAGADDAHALVREAAHAAFGGATCVGVVPPRGVEGVPLEVLDAGYPGELRVGECAGGVDDVRGAERVTAVRGHGPGLGRLVPGQFGDAGGEQGVGVEVVPARDPHRVAADLVPGGVLPLRHVSGLVQHRQVHVRLDVAVDARVPVPVPGAPEVAALLHDPHAPHAPLPQPRPGEDAAESAADHGDVDGVVAGVALSRPLGVRVGGVVAELRVGVPVLGGSVGADASLTFEAVALPQGGQLVGGGRLRGRHVGASILDGGTALEGGRPLR